MSLIIKPRRKKIRIIILILILLGRMTELAKLMEIANLIANDAREDYEFGLEETDVLNALNALYAEFDSEDDPDNFDEFAVTELPTGFTSKMSDLASAIDNL